MPIVRSRKMGGERGRTILYYCEDTSAPAAHCVEKYHDIFFSQTSLANWENELKETASHTGNSLVVQLYNADLHPPGAIYLQCYDGDMFEFTRRSHESQLLPFEDLQCFGAQMLDAVAYLHSQGVSHRDIKLENFFRRGRSVCIGDLETATRQEWVLPGKGTRQYWSFAAVSGLPFRAAEADLWALAVTLFAFVFGTIPYQEVSHMTDAQLMEVIRSVEEDKPSFWWRICKWQLPRTDDPATMPACFVFFDACLVAEADILPAATLADLFRKAFRAL